MNIINNNEPIAIPAIAPGSDVSGEGRRWVVLLLCRDDVSDEDKLVYCVDVDVEEVSNKWSLLGLVHKTIPE
jgi:hypothetical protein